MSIYKLSKDAVFEAYKDGGAILILSERRFVELTPFAVEVVKLLDGYRTLEQVTAEIEKYHNISHYISVTNSTQVVLDLCVQLEKSGALKFQPDIQESVDMTTVVTACFLQNPDVVLREEDPDEGGLLFNPDTNQVKVINATGLFIWQQCSTARTLNEIVSEVQKDFDDVPLDQVSQDVKEFIDDMLSSGFIGILEEKG